ncbi:MAG: ribulose-phosphate 3-epimerase, partial [Thermoguttaceae bacterium]|nr:ribulose-phosphate 3-epimerase [Thermoguttaceae bacterium]
FSTSPDWIREIIQNKAVIAPSLLAADFANLEKEVRRLEAAGVQVLHVDVMDGHFVPNISIGVPVVESLRKVTNLKLDVHLMISEPWKYIEAFRRTGADSLLVHIEVVPEPEAILDKIRDLGAVPGLVHNPGTPVEKLLPHLEKADIVLTMSVQPGFGGQAFRPEVLDKVRILKQHVRPDTVLSIDGGIDESTIQDAAAAGIGLFVAGTGFFRADDYHKQLDKLTQLALLKTK